MAAVVRLKRRCDEEPLEAVMLACKRKKTESDLKTTENGTPIQTIFKFAGTVKNQEEDVTSHIHKMLGEDTKIPGWRHNVDVTRKVRTQRRQLAQENRLKVVNCFRDLRDLDVLESEKETEVASKDENKSFTIFDVVSHVNDGQESNLSSQSQMELDPGGENYGPDEGYVYDLFYTSLAGTDDLVDLDELRIMPYTQSCLEYYDSDNSSDKSCEEEDEDDSNDENNWRNDYPDSDDSNQEDDLRMWMQVGDLNLGDEADLSSGDSYEDFAYGIRVDPQDVALYGEGYAHYKAVMKHSLYDSEYQDEAYDHERTSDDEDPAEEPK